MIQNSRHTVRIVEPISQEQMNHFYMHFPWICPGDGIKSDMKTSEVLQTGSTLLADRAPSLSIEIKKECSLRCPGCHAFDATHLGNTIQKRQLSDFKRSELINSSPSTKNGKLLRHRVFADDSEGARTRSESVGRGKGGRYCGTPGGCGATGRVTGKVVARQTRGAAPQAPLRLLKP
jgi:hypothetical protein